MNQAQLVGRLAKKQKLAASRAKEMVQLVLSTIQDTLLKGENVRTTLGTFSVAKRAARNGVNPKTGERLMIKASRGVRFKASKTVKDKLNRR